MTDGYLLNIWAGDHKAARDLLIDKYGHRLRDKECVIDKVYFRSIFTGRNCCFTYPITEIEDEDISVILECVQSPTPDGPHIDALKGYPENGWVALLVLVPVNNKNYVKLYLKSPT